MVSMMPHVAAEPHVMSVNCFPCPGDDPEMFGLSSRQRPTSAAKMLVARLDACNLILIFRILTQ